MTWSSPIHLNFLLSSRSRAANPHCHSNRYRAENGCTKKCQKPWITYHCPMSDHPQPNVRCHCFLLILSPKKLIFRGGRRFQLLSLSFKCPMSRFHSFFKTFKIAHRFWMPSKARWVVDQGLAESSEAISGRELWWLKTRLWSFNYPASDWGG